jgi:deazaflavin-dependent oxidoreductase (nitroreductase family)
VIIVLQRFGIAFFSFHLLSIAGRRSGSPRTTPVSPFAVNGVRYVMSFGQTEWVKNARAAGTGVLSRGRRHEPVALVELPPDQRSAIARAFPSEVPHGVDFYLRLGVVEPPGDPDAFAAAAPRLAVFSIDPLPPLPPAS